MTDQRLSATVRRCALPPAARTVSGWAIPTGQVAARHLPVGRAGLAGGGREERWT